MSPAAEVDRRPIARLRLKKVAVPAETARVPVFHVFQELYARAARETATAGTSRPRA